MIIWGEKQQLLKESSHNLQKEVAVCQSKINERMPQTRNTKSSGVCSFKSADEMCFYADPTEVFHK